MATKLKIANYLLPDTIAIDPKSDEVYIIHSPRDDPEDVTKRLTRNTFSSESKLYPWSKPLDRIWRKAVIVNKNPTFECVTKDKAMSITERVSRPTKSSSIRRNDEVLSTGSFSRPSTRDSSSTTSSFSYRGSNSIPVRYDLTKPVPRASARPERPILRTPSRQRSRSSSSATKTPPRYVRFQSPLPPMPSRTVSRASIGSSINSNQVEESSSTTKAVSNRISSPKKSSVFNSSIFSNQVEESDSSTKAVSNRVSSPKKSSENKENNNEVKSKKKKEEKVSSPENKNMELVLNFFSKLPPV